MRRLLPRLPASPVEQSPEARIFVLAAFTLACGAVAVYGQDYLLPALCVPVAALGHYVSYRGRAKRRTVPGQILVAGLVFVAMAYFLADSAGAIFGGEMPQANFAVLLVAVTSFDLKTRRNCYSSLWISLAIVYLAAVYAWDYVFAGFAAAWIVCLAGFWVASHLRRMDATAFRIPLAPSAIALLGALAVGAAAFVFIPQPQGLPTGPLVVSLPSFTQFKGEIESPALPLVQVNGSVNSVDLRYRGRLGDTPVMYVRTGAPAYWRGLVFDTYDNGVWTATPGNLGLYPPYVPPRLLPRAPDSSLGTFVQTFRLLRDMAPVIDAAYPIESLYVPVAQLARDHFGTFHTPDVLRAGTTYSVVSYIPNLSAAQLRQDPFPEIDPGSAEWPLGLDGLSKSAILLAQRAVAGHRATEYDAVTALVSYLQHNYTYSLQVGHAQGDPIDQFLFVDKFGYCEQFASAATLMLRSLGIPARLVTGYSTGEYDPVLNQAIVREKDAHAWVEAWFPGDGWVPVDPTPGFSGVPATQFPNRWAASGLARLIPHLTIGAPPVVLGSLGALGVIPLGVGIALAIVLLFAWLRTWRRRRLAAALAPPGSNELLRLYDHLQRRAGRRRAPPETPSEYRETVVPDPVLDEVTDAVNEGAYAGRWPDAERVKELASRLS